MLKSAIIRTVEFCTRHVWGVIILALILAAVAGTYTVRHFSIDTNVNNLISRDLPWRKRELEYQAAFPQSRQPILVVVEAPTPEQTSAATRTLAEGLAKKADRFRSVQEEGAGRSFSRTVSCSYLRSRSHEAQVNSRTPNRSSASWRRTRACAGSL
jgi:predicted RND superfamily exporter protein